MDRQIIYSGAIPLDTDQLSQNKNAMIALGYIVAAILGSSTLFDGLACTPTAPASLQVLIAPGSVFALENVDSTAYGSLAADTAHQVMKQGISLSTLTLNCPAPSTTGQSINYLIQGAYQDADAGPVVLPYYNSANPSVAYNGPNNSGTSQNTVRQGQCIIAVKAGVAANTGSQTTPAPDAGYTGLWVVTVANTQTQINSGNIAQVAGAPFISEKLKDKISIATGDARYLTSSAGLLSKAANLSDLASLATALTNLTFGSNGASYFQVPNPSDPTKPWIIQFGFTTVASGYTALSTIAVTLPVTMPHQVTGTFCNSSDNGSLAASTAGSAVVDTGHIALWGGNTGGAVHLFWIAIGN